jgi:uncharacterized membrane protein YdjX (TVP38/TMEM64 family)
LAVCVASAYAFGVRQDLSWTALAEHQAALFDLVQAHPAEAAIAYVGIYILVVGLSVPGAVVLTVAGGLLFGTLPGAMLAIIGSTAGAAVLFLIARTILAGWFAARIGGVLDRVRPGLQRDGFRYLLALRLLPVIPFWVVNLVPALIGMRFLPYIAATFFGIIPTTTIFASFGDGLGGVLASGGQPNLSLLFSAPVLLPLAGLALLTLAPIAWRRARGSERS